MTYKNCKELKDAGFPQDGDNITSFQGEAETVYVNSIDSGSNDYCYVPTLSELIEACGGNLDGIMKSKGEWVAMKDRYKSSGECFFGSTPEEAVARLWIELNK